MNEPPDRNAWARQWLAFARSDLEVAAALVEMPAISPRHVCWHVQQAIEKAIKAVLVLEGVSFPRTHDLDALRRRLPPDWGGALETTLDLTRATAWATDARYPSLMDAVSAEDARTGYHQAAPIIEEVGGVIDSRLGDTGPPSTPPTSAPPPPSPS